VETCLHFPSTPSWCDAQLKEITLSFIRWESAQCGTIICISRNGFIVVTLHIELVLTLTDVIQISGRPENDYI
jgi:hypothetical protein